MGKHTHIHVYIMYKTDNNMTYHAHKVLDMTACQYCLTTDAQMCSLAMKNQRGHHIAEVYPF